MGINDILNVMEAQHRSCAKMLSDMALEKKLNFEKAVRVLGKYLEEEEAKTPEYFSKILVNANILHNLIRNVVDIARETIDNEVSRCSSNEDQVKVISEQNKAMSKLILDSKK